MEIINIEILDEEGGTSDQTQTGSGVPSEYVVNEVDTSSDDEGEKTDRRPSDEPDQVPTPVSRMAEVETSNGGGDQQPQSGSQFPPEVVQIVVQPRLLWRPRRRIFQKVPPLLLTEEKKRQDYIPKVVSIGPYHHGKQELSLAEAFKPTAVDLFVLGSGRTRRFYYDKVVEMIGEIRRCYEEGSTDAYSDSELAKMMLLDACFTIIHIEIGTPPEGESEMHGHEHRLKILKVMTVVQDLGLLTSAIVLRDLFLLENQIPLSILKLLIDLRYGNGAGEKLLNRFLNGTLFGVYEPRRRLPLEHGAEPLHLLEAFRRVVVCDWIEPEERRGLCYKFRWLRFFRVEREPRPSPPINAEPSVNPSASSDLEAGIDPTTHADPAMAGTVKCRCLRWKQCCLCFKCRWLCCFRVDQEPHACPPINAETSVNPSASSDLEGGTDPTTNADPAMAGVKCRCLCWKQCCLCFKCRWLCCFRVDQEPHPSPPINAETRVNRSTGVNAAMCSMCRFLCCRRVQEIDRNPATNTNVDTNVNLTTVVDQAIGASPVTNIDPSAPADQATRWRSRLSNLRSRIRLRRGVGREMSNVGLRRDVKKELHSFRSVMDLKAKGIEVEPSSSRSLKDVKFKSRFFCTQLKLPTWFVSIYTKIFFLNMIAFELSPNNLNNHTVTSYINLMKSLIESPEDVKELREKKILFNLLGSDKQVVQVYKEIETHNADNPLIFRNVKDKIQAHYNSKMKTWIGEFIHTHFRTPWTFIGLVAAISLLAIASANLYYSVHRKSDK